MIKKLLLAGSGTVLAVASLVVFSFVASASSGAAITYQLTTTGNAISAPGPVCPPFLRSLSVGATGSDVTALQTYLKSQGFLNANATGYFGSLTKAALVSWQAKQGVVASGAAGSGIFGPLSRGYFLRVCGIGSNPGGGTGTPTSTQNALNFTANPSSGMAPLNVQFTVSAPQGTTFGNTVNFGDGATGTLAFAPVCSNCNLLATVSHTYASAGTYNATVTNGVNCSCPAGQICGCPNIMILSTATVTVTATSTPITSTSTGATIQQLNSPGSVTLAVGGIAEVRNANFYFSLSNLNALAAIINITPVGCWNSFPSDPTPTIRCMIAIMPTPPQTLTVGQKYAMGNFVISLTSINGSTATFSVQQ